MYEVFLESPGILFVKANGNVVRTPIKFKIEESELQLYESLIRVSPISKFTITKIEKIEKIDTKKKVPKRSLKRPRTNIGLNFKIKG